MVDSLREAIRIDMETDKKVIEKTKERYEKLKSKLKREPSEDEVRKIAKEEREKSGYWKRKKAEEHILKKLIALYRSNMTLYREMLNILKKEQAKARKYSYGTHHCADNLPLMLYAAIFSKHYNSHGDWEASEHEELIDLLEELQLTDNYELKFFVAYDLISHSYGWRAYGKITPKLTPLLLDRILKFLKKETEVGIKNRCEVKTHHHIIMG